MIKRYLISAIVVTFFITAIAGCFLFENRELDVPVISSLIVKDQPSFPNIEISWTYVEDAEIYEIARRAPEDGRPEYDTLGKWDNSQWYEDNGTEFLPDGIVPGHTYYYKVRAHANDGGFGPYSPELSIRVPAFLPPENLTAVLSGDGEAVILEWDDVEDGTSYKIYRSEQSDDNSPDHRQTVYESTYTDNYIYTDVTYYYRVKAVNAHWGETDYSATADLNTTPELPSVAYSQTNLGNITLNGDDSYSEEVVGIAVDQGAAYVAYWSNSTSDDHAGVFGGSPWEEIEGIPAGVPLELQDTAVGRLSFTAGTGTLHISATDYYTVFIHTWDGSEWSANLAGNHFGIIGDSDDRAHEVKLAVLGEELYAAQIPDAETVGENNVKVSRYDNGSSEWVHTGGDPVTGLISTSNEVVNIILKNLGGILYLAYTEDLRTGDNGNDRLTIRHWTGSDWVVDLQWDQDWLGDFDIALADGTLYVTASSYSFSAWTGGTFSVTSASGVTSISETVGENITSDSDGNLIMLTPDHVLFSQAPLVIRSHWKIIIYDGFEWSEIDSDFTDTSVPGRITTEGNDIYFVYGSFDSCTISEEGTVNETVGPPAVLNAVKLLPQ